MKKQSIAGLCLKVDLFKALLCELNALQLCTLLVADRYVVDAP